MGPLSGKQQREWAKHQAKEQRESAKLMADEARKQQLHQIKLQETAAKANQGLSHKDDVHALKVKELGGPLGGKSPRMNRQKLGLPSMNPMAGTEVFKQGQHMLSKGTDTVPAMLTPGEAVIPRAAAQNPKNKPIIKQMVQEGRMANRAKGYEDGTPAVPDPYMADLQQREAKDSSQQFQQNMADMVRSSMKFANGTESIPNIAGNTYHTDSVATLNDGTMGVKYYEDGITDAQKNLASDNLNSNIIKDVALGAAAMPAAVVATPFAGAYNLGVDALEGVANSRLGNFISGNTDELKIPRIERPNLVKANWQDTKAEIAKDQAAYQQALVPKEQPKPVSLNEVSATSKEVPKPVVFTKPSGEDAWVQAQESSGNPLAKNPNSSASGLYQMTNGAWVDAIKQNPELAKLDRTSVEAQQAGRDAYKEVLAKQLRSKGIEPTEEAIRKAWVVGAGGYANILNADPNSPLAVSKDAIAINPNLQGKTNAEFIADANPYSRKDKNYVPQPRIQPEPTSPEQVKLAKAYDDFKKGGPAPKEAPEEVVERDARVAEFTKTISQDEEFNNKVDQLVADKTSAPEVVKNKLSSFFQYIYGPTGIFNERELVRFSLLAATSKMMGYNTFQSVRYAGRDTLATADKRYNAEAAARVESAKNERELIERLDQDYRTALGGNVPPEIRKAAMSAWGPTKTADQKRRVIELIRANTDHNVGEGSKPAAPQNGYIDGKPVQFRSFKGENQIVDPKDGQWKPTRETIITETQHRQNKSDMLNDSADRITPLLMNTYGKGNKDYTHGHATAEAKGHAQTLALLQNELGGKVDSTSFAKMAESTMRSAIDTAKATGTQLTEEGIRKAFYGNAVIEGRMGTNRTLYMTGDKKNPLPAAEYQAVLGNYLDAQKKSKGLNAGESANALEQAWAALPKDQQKKYTDMSKGAPGSTPMLFWLYKTGGN